MARNALENYRRKLDRAVQAVLEASAAGSDAGRGEGTLDDLQSIARHLVTLTEEASGGRMVDWSRLRLGPGRVSATSAIRRDPLYDD